MQDFVDEIQKYLERDIDILIVNSKHIELSFGELEKLKSNVSVQWGDYIYLTKKERDIFRKQGIKIIEDDLIDRDTLYKHDRKQLGKVLKKIIL